jgi:hypothetical protein
MLEWIITREQPSPGHFDGEGKHLANLIQAIKPPGRAAMARIHVGF